MFICMCITIKFFGNYIIEPVIYDINEIKCTNYSCDYKYNVFTCYCNTSLNITNSNSFYYKCKEPWNSLLLSLSYLMIVVANWTMLLKNNDNFTYVGNTRQFVVSTLSLMAILNIIIKIDKYFR